MRDYKQKIEVEAIQRGVIISLQRAVQKLGPMPDKLGSITKNILADFDVVKHVNLGVALEQCIDSNSWNVFEEYVN